MKKPFLLVLTIIALVGASLGAYWYFRSETVSHPIPPDVDDYNLEPAVIAEVKKMRELVLKDPTSAEAWGNLGKAFIANELEPESSICFAEAERLDPGDPQWPYLQAIPIINKGNRELALPYLQRTVDRLEARKDDTVSPRLILAETLMTLGKDEEAEAQIQRVLAVVPESVRAKFDLAALVGSRRDWQSARSILLGCLSSPYTQQRARIQLAGISRRLGDFPKAEEFQKEADRLPQDIRWLDPFVDDYDSRFAKKKKRRYRYAENMEAVGRFEEAARVLQPMTEDYPDDYVPHYTLGKVLGQKGDFSGAERALRRSVALAPDKMQSHHYLALILFEQGEKLKIKGSEDPARKDALYREAVTQAREALAIKNDYGMAHMVLGLSLKRLGERTEARIQLEQAVRCNPNYGELHFYLAEMLAEEGLVAEARSRFEQALLLAPPNAPWRLKVETQLLELKKAESATVPPKK